MRLWNGNQIIFIFELSIVILNPGQVLENLFKQEGHMTPSRSANLIAEDVQSFLLIQFVKIDGRRAFNFNQIRLIST
jgi:hypothetical protein